MTDVVFDASAVLAIIQKEPGYQNAQKQLSSAIISSVNFSEVICVLVRNNIALVDARRLLLALVKGVISFDEEQATITGSLKELSKKHGLSLGDCACLSLGLVKRLKIITADKVWKKLKIDGVDVEVIR